MTEVADSRGGRRFRLTLWPGALRSKAVGQKSPAESRARSSGQKSTARSPPAKSPRPNASGQDGFIEIAAPFNASLYDGDKVLLHDRTHRHTETFRFPGIDQYRLQVESFADAIAGKGTELFSLESSRRNQAAIDALFEAGRTGDWVEVSG